MRVEVLGVFCRGRWPLAMAIGLSLLAAPLASPAWSAACTPPSHLGVAFSLDDSGSMTDSDPDNLRGVAAGIGLDALPDGATAAASTFADGSTSIFDASTLDPSNRAGLKGQIADSLLSTGGTDYDEAFQLAATQLDAMTGADKRALIFLSDGEPSYSYSGDQQLDAAGIPIYAIGFGSAPPDELSAIAQRSGGEAYAIENAGEAQSVFDRIIGQLDCDSSQVSDDIDLQPGQQRDYPISVDATDGEFRTLASWSIPGGVSAWITRPDGSSVDPNAARGGEKVDTEPTYTAADVQYPTSGAWALHVRAANNNADSVHVSIDVFKRTGAVPDAQSFYSSDIKALTVETPAPALFELPFGVAVVPSVDVTGRISPGEAPPAVTPLSTTFMTWYGGSFSVADMTWHPAAGEESDHDGSLFAGTKLGFDDFSAGVKLEPPTIEGSGGDSNLAFPVAHASASLLTVKMQPPSAPVAQLQLEVGAKLKVQLYLAQGVAYAGEKIAEGLVGAASSVLTDGVAAPLVIDAIETQLGYEIGVTAYKVSVFAGQIQKQWNLLVNTGIPLATIFDQALKAGAPNLVQGVAAYLSKELKATVSYVANGVKHTVSAVYDGGKWVVKEGGKAIDGAGHVVSSGYHFVTGIFSLTPAQIAAGSFEALPISTLRLGRVRQARGLGFGTIKLTRARAMADGRALVKYGLSKMTVRPLLVSATSLHAGGTLRVAGGRLSRTGTAVVELTGPGYRAQKLVRLDGGVAGAVIRLPKPMASGRWTVGIVDYATAKQHAGVLVDAASFTVKQPKKRKAKHQR